MGSWGPADWYVVLGTALGILGPLFWALTNPASWSSWWAGFRKRPPCDPEYRKPYVRPTREDDHGHGG